MSIYYAEPETKPPVNPERCSNGKTSDPFPAYDQKLLLQKGSYLYRQVQIWFLRQEMESSEQEIELFFLLPGLWYKNLNLLKSFNWFSKEEIELSKQEMELSKQEMELFLQTPGLF